MNVLFYFLQTLSQTRMCVFGNSCTSHEAIQVNIFSNSGDFINAILNKGGCPSGAPSPRTHSTDGRLRRPPHPPHPRARQAENVANTEVWRKEGVVRLAAKGASRWRMAGRRWLRKAGRGGCAHVVGPCAPQSWVLGPAWLFFQSYVPPGESLRFLYVRLVFGYGYKCLCHR